MINKIIIFILAFKIYFCQNQVFSMNNQRTCEPEIIDKYINIEEKLKVCDKGNRIIIRHNFNLSSDILIGKICDLKYTVLHDKNKDKIINSKIQQPDFVCIYLP